MKRLNSVTLISISIMLFTMAVSADILPLAENVQESFLIRVDWEDMAAFADPIPVECGEAAECWKIPVAGHPHMWVLAKNFWGSHGSPSTWTLRLMQTEYLPAGYWVGIDGIQTMMAFYEESAPARIYEVDLNTIGFARSVTVEVACISGIGDDVPIEDLEIGTDKEWWAGWVETALLRASRLKVPSTNK